MILYTIFSKSGPNSFYPLCLAKLPPLSINIVLSSVPTDKPFVKSGESSVLLIKDFEVEIK
jgi:hypothetical protein